jgi:hypothetical protein
MSGRHDEEQHAQEPRRPAAIEVQLPHPPTGEPHRSSGKSQLDAEQAADRDVRSGAVDPENVEAGVGPLGFDTLREAEANLEQAIAKQESLEAEATGKALIEGARQGAQSAQPRWAFTTSQAGAKAEADRTHTARKKAEETNAHDNAVLDGTAIYHDGSHRPGEMLSPGITHLKWAVFRATIAAWLPLLLPAAVEFWIVASNMRSYLRTDDSDLLTPATIAVTTVMILTVIPFLLGRWLAGVQAGRKASAVDRVAALVAAAFWLGVGATLAIVRVQVDQANAIAKANSDYRVAVQQAQSLGQSADSVPPVDPATVFNPLLPTILWIIVLCGLGVALIWFELNHSNPARLAELKSRAVLVEAVDRDVEAIAWVAQLEGAVDLQTAVLETTREMWKHEPEAIRHRAARDVQIYRSTLATASGDPRMVLAIEARDAATADNPRHASSLGVAKPESHPEETTELPSTDGEAA